MRHELAFGPAGHVVQVGPALDENWYVRVLSLCRQVRPGSLRRREHMKSVPLDPSGRKEMYGYTEMDLLCSYTLAPWSSPLDIKTDSIILCAYPAHAYVIELSITLHILRKSL